MPARPTPPTPPTTPTPPTRAARRDAPPATELEELHPMHEVVGPWGAVGRRPRLLAWFPAAKNLAAITADPGSRQWALGALGAALLLVPLVVFLQQFTLGLRSMTLDRAPESVRTAEPIGDPGISALATESKLMVKLDHWAKAVQRRAEQAARAPRSRARTPEPVSEPAEEADQDADAHEDLAALESMAVTRTDRLRFAAVAGELLGKAAALSRLEALDAELEPTSELKADLHWFRLAFKDGGRALPEDARDSIIGRHGWFGELAASHGLPDSDPVRGAAVAGGGRILGFLVAYGGFALLAGLGALVAGCVLGSKALNRTLEARFEPPEPGGSVYLESYVLFCGLFSLLMLLTLIMFNIGAEGTTGALVFLEVVTWSLVLVPLWPVVRGVPWRRVLHDLGWTRGEGWAKEIGCGVLGWLAGILVTIAGAFITAAIERALGGGAAAPTKPGGYPLFEPPSSASWWVLVLDVASTVVWAPVVEESIFRGALYRHLRARLRPIWCVLITAALFGAAHPYSVGGLVSVGLAGLVFGALREWRGSLVAPAVAHALHNGTIMLVTVGLVAAAG